MGLKTGCQRQKEGGVTRSEVGEMNDGASYSGNFKRRDSTIYVLNAPERVKLCLFFTLLVKTLVE